MSGRLSALRLFRLKPAGGSRSFSADDAHGPEKLNAWEAPTDPASWKGEHVVFASIAFWAALIYGGSKMMGGKKEEPKKVTAAAPAKKH